MAKAKKTPTTLIDDQLARYRSMRDFSITEEPSGSSKGKKTEGLPFVIQKHAASHLHYDFRLGWNGVLKSWAVAKGPSYFTGDRRLAVQVEDHPMEYGGFEGIIPKGQYGGGTVMVWDQGTWEPHGDVDEGLEKGSLKFGMKGSKMHGNWTLVRMNNGGWHGKSSSGKRWGSSDKPNWLLIKEHDEYERSKDDPCVTEEEPNSAVTGRTMDQIAQAETHIWQSNRTNSASKAWHHGSEKDKKSTNSNDLEISEAAKAQLGIGTEAEKAASKRPAKKTPTKTASKSAAKKTATKSASKSATKKTSAKSASKRTAKAASKASPKSKTKADPDPATPVSAESMAEPSPKHRHFDRGEAQPNAAEKPASRQRSKTADTLNNLPSERLPNFIAPQLATHVAQPPQGDNWLHELKLDGYRVQAHKHGDKVKLYTRSGLDWTHRMKPIAEAVKHIAATDAILDGEVVVLDEDGNSSFAKLQASFEHGEKHPLTYFVFDLLHLDGKNTRGATLLERKALLKTILSGDVEAIRFNEHIEGSGEAVFHKACEMHAEGVIAKNADKPYFAGRSASWLKLKCVREQEFVIGGFTFPTNGSHGIGALLLGYYDDNGKLIYAGRTGTGFNQKTHRSMRDMLDNLAQKSKPFASIPLSAQRGVTWVKPEKVAQVRFATWTSDNLVRQAAFLGLREDKPASEVKRELPTTPPRPRSPRGRTLHVEHRESPQNAPQSTVKSTVPAPQNRQNSSNSPHAPVRLTHPEKVLDEATKLTKQQLADYYWAVAEHMLPHIANRPLSLVRCPEGSTKPCFFQKHVNHMLPPGIGSVTIADKKGKEEPYITLNNREALAGLAQMGVLEVHPWGSTNSSLERPNRIILDLDPDPAITWQRLAQSAKEVRKMLKSIGLQSFLKTTGGKGLHIVIPIAQRYEWPVVKQWAQAFAAAMEANEPDLYLIKMTKSARKNKIFVDYLRNERGATAVAPFSPRAREGAPVSVPLAWKELDAPEHPKFAVSNFEQWKARLKKDPWMGIDDLKQKLPAVDDVAAA